MKHENHDEILVVAHSVGPKIMTSVIANVIAKGSLTDKKIKILTLGQCIPICSYLPWSRIFNDELRILAENKNLYWLDVTSPADPASNYSIKPFYRVAKNVKSKVEKTSPRFHLMFNRGYYQNIKSDKFRMHFQYLMSGDKISDYDYFDLAAGPNNFLDNFLNPRQVIICIK